MSEYRVIVIGGLLPEHDRETALRGLVELFKAPPETLRQVFDGESHPVKGAFDAERALELQRQLERLGVRSRIERMGEHRLELEMRESVQAASNLAAAASRGSAPAYRAAPVSPADSPAFAGRRMHCPACGHEQSVADSCEACGIVFANFEQRRVTARDQTRRSSQPRPVIDRPARTDDNWKSAWVDLEEDREPDENHFLGLFAGPAPMRYLRVFERFKRGPRRRLPLGWNWGAVFSPFLWAMYRKLWFWAMVIGVFEILVPTAAFVLGTREGFSQKYFYLGWAALIGSRLFWPAVVDFLYFRHARRSIMRLHRMAPTYAADIDVATAGGVSNSAVFVGITFSLVFGLFFWSVIESLNIGGYSRFDPRLAEALDEVAESPRRAPVREPVRPSPARTAENSWAETRQRLRSLGQQIQDWLVQNNKVDDPGAVNLFILRQQLQIPVEALRDGWGGEIQYVADIDGYRLISAGPDRLFGTADDIQFRRTLN